MLPSAFLPVPPPSRSLLQCQERLDPVLARHGGRVGHYARLIGGILGLSPALLDRLELGAQLHDIGKLFIPAFLVHKPTTFNREEYQIMQRHVLLGARLLESRPETAVLAEVARHHHARWDGGGYPSRLRGREIPFLARIASVADSYDAMTSDRAGGHRRHEVALRELLRGRGAQFCPEVVEAFEAVDADARSLANCRER